MSGQTQPCENCGAPIHRLSDGKWRDCEYCSLDGGKALDPALIASTMKGAIEDLDQLFHHLAERLAASFPDHTEVEHSGGLISSKKVKLLAVTCEPHVYRMRRDGKHVVTERAKVVRGVVIKTSELRVDEWVQELARDLTQMAKTTAASRAALARWVRGA